MARYHFVTVIRLDAPVERVWDALSDPRSWPSWWRWLERVDLLREPRHDGTGARHRFTFATALPYTLSFVSESVRVQRPVRAEARVTGDLEGTGVWRLRDVGDGTTVAHYTWIVATTRAWMNVLAPLARPLFAWNHDVLMRGFARGLAGSLGAALLACENAALRPQDPGFGTVPRATA